MIDLEELSQGDLVMLYNDARMEIYKRYVKG